MKPSKKSISILLFLLFVSLNGICQEMNYATNIKTEISDDKMLITYDAVSIDGIPYFHVILLITHNGEKVQANSAYGDFGNRIASGTEKTIVWYYKDDFKGDIRNVVVTVFAHKPGESLLHETAPESKESPFESIFGVRGGVNLANMLVMNDDTTFSDDYKMKPGFQIGLTAEFPLSGMVSFETGLLFSSKGTKMQRESSGSVYKASIVLNYLEMPLDAKIYFTEGKARVFGLLGPYIGYGLNGKLKAEYITNEQDEPVTDTRDVKWGSDPGDNFKRLDFGLTAGAGIEIKPVSLGLTYNYGLANISSSSDNGLKINNRVLGIYAGIILFAKEK